VSGINFTADTSEANYLTGFLKGVSEQIRTDQHMGPVLKYVHAELAQAFDDYMTAVSTADPSRFHHVYEWNQIGNPQAKLWKNVLRGQGGNRTATWTWRASKTIVPVTAEAQDVGVEAVHIFVWKAPVMEYATNITIRPSRKTGLAFFTGPTSDDGRWELRFTKSPIDVQNPGGAQVKGAFTAAFLEWWSETGGAGAEFSRRIRRVLEQDFANMPNTFKRGTRVRTKTFSITGETAGHKAAQAWLRARDNKYIEMAAARSRMMGDDNDG
jgi:hypothetical protein